MFQEITSLNEGQYPNCCVIDQPPFDSDDSPFYQSFSSLNNIFDNTQIPISSDFPNKSEEFSLNDFSPQSLNMTNNFSNSPQFLQQESPSIATSTELDWITTSNTDIKIQSPLDPSSPRTSMSPLYSSRSKSSMLIQSSGSSFERSSPDVSISHHEFPTSSDSMGKYTNTTSPAVKPVEPPKKTKGTPGRKRKFQDHELSPAEAARRNIRRERNKVAAAKCRNRRRDLTNQLQGETDRLEDAQQMLQKEIISLQREKQQLELLLTSHEPNCKAGIFDNSDMLPSHDTCQPITGENYPKELQQIYNQTSRGSDLKLFHYTNDNSLNHLSSHVQNPNNLHPIVNPSQTFIQRSRLAPIQQNLNNTVVSPAHFEPFNIHSSPQVPFSSFTSVRGTSPSFTFQGGNRGVSNPIPHSVYSTHATEITEQPNPMVICSQDQSYPCNYYQNIGSSHQGSLNSNSLSPTKSLMAL